MSKPVGWITSTATSMQAASRRMVPAFCGMSGSYNARRMLRFSRPLGRSASQFADAKWTAQDMRQIALALPMRRSCVQLRTMQKDHASIRPVGGGGADHRQFFEGLEVLPWGRMGRLDHGVRPAGHPLLFVP